MEEEEGEVVIIMVGGTAKGQDPGAIMVVVDIGITDVRETDLESEAGHQKKRGIVIKVRAQIGVAHQGGREREWRRRGRGKGRGMIAIMGQRDHTISAVPNRY